MSNNSKHKLTNKVANKPEWPDKEGPRPPMPPREIMAGINGTAKKDKGTEDHEEEIQHKPDGGEVG